MVAIDYLPITSIKSSTVVGNKGIKTDTFSLAPRSQAKVLSYGDFPPISDRCQSILCVVFFIQ